MVDSVPSKAEKGGLQGRWADENSISISCDLIERYRFHEQIGRPVEEDS